MDSRSWVRSVAGSALAGVLSACAGTPDPDHCEISVVQRAFLEEVSGGVDVGYLVRGEAGSPGTAWLAARKGKGDYIAGRGVAVGPGPFEATVQIELTGEAPGYVAVLEVAGKRCRDDAR